MKHKIAVFLLAFAPIAYAFQAAAGSMIRVVEGSEINRYYRDRLSDPLAEKIYDAFENMDFSTGENIRIKEGIQAAAKSYTEGDPSLLKSFGAALDSFRFDHTELFYVDFDRVSFSIGKSGDEYVMTLGSGRTDTYFVDGITVENVDEKIRAYDDALQAFVSDIAADTVAEKAAAVNQKVCDRVAYSFCADDAEKAPFIRTSFGALIYGHAVCEGYARLYKAAMNRLGVPCELISGYLSEGEKAEPHMWNYVLDSESWYAVDPTVNDGNARPVLMSSSDDFSYDHFEDPVVSSSAYSMPYPALHRSEYITDSGRLNVAGALYGGEKAIAVSYDGWNARDLTQKEHLYIAFRMASTNEGVKVWSPWSTAQFMEVAYQGIVASDDAFTYYLIERGGIHISDIMVGIFDCPADDKADFAIKDIDGTTPLCPSYSEKSVGDHLLEVSSEIKNPEHDPTYIRPAYIEKISPSDFGQRPFDVEQEIALSVTYDQKLKKIVDGDPVEIDVTFSHADDREIIDSEVRKNLILKNVEWDGESTVSFTFRASPMFQHNGLTYHFNVKNLVGDLGADIEGKAPIAFGGIFSRTSFVCSKIFDDGRLYMDVYGQPTIVGNSDLSLSGWKYEDNDGKEHLVSENQRSQLALVVSKPEEIRELEDATKRLESSVLHAETYELNLNICNGTPIIPNGSYLKLSFGFPAGYGPDDEGVTFKVYHFKRTGSDLSSIDYDHPEVLDCVITKYGLVVTVDSFSPFVIAALLSDGSKETKGILTECNGWGGTVGTASKKPVEFVSVNESVTYSFAPKKGYSVEYVLLNGKAMTVENDQLTLRYDDLKENNVLTVGFVSETIKEKEKQDGISDLTFEFYTLSDRSDPKNPSSFNIRKLLILIGIGIAVLLLLIGFCSIRRRKKRARR